MISLSIDSRYIFTGILIAALQLWHPWVEACSNVLLTSSNSHFGMVHRIEAALFSRPELGLKLTHVVADAVDTLPDLNQNSPCLIVTIGSEALAMVLKTQTKIPIFSVLCRKNAFNTLLKDYQRLQNNPDFPITAIYLDQPWHRQLHLLQCLLPLERRHIGILLGPYSLEELEYFQQLAKEKSFLITGIYVNRFENPVEILDTLLNDTNVVLAVPDPQIYNPKTARGILLTAFHKHIPLIGYSHTFVNNGALAAVFSTTKQYAEQAAQQIIQITQNPNKPLPLPQYPKDFTIAINSQVAKSLGIAIKSESALKYQMDIMEASIDG